MICNNEQIHEDLTNAFTTYQKLDTRENVLRAAGERGWVQRLNGSFHQNVTKRKEDKIRTGL